MQRDIADNHALNGTNRKLGTRDADILVLLWETFRTHGNEIDSLLDLSLSILASTANFPQKDDLESSLKKALVLIRNIA